MVEWRSDGFFVKCLLSLFMAGFAEPSWEYVAAEMSQFISGSINLSKKRRLIYLMGHGQHHSCTCDVSGSSKEEQGQWHIQGLTNELDSIHGIADGSMCVVRVEGPCGRFNGCNNVQRS